MARRGPRHGVDWGYSGCFLASRKKGVRGKQRRCGDRLGRTRVNDRFSSEVAEKLDFYVYRLIDPRNGETFYVGKGRGNHVFTHAAGEPDAGQDALSDKLVRIRQIRVSGF